MNSIPFYPSNLLKPTFPFFQIFQIFHICIYVYFHLSCFCSVYISHGERSRSQVLRLRFRVLGAMTSPKWAPQSRWLRSSELIGKLPGKTMAVSCGFRCFFLVPIYGYLWGIPNSWMVFFFPENRGKSQSKMEIPTGMSRDHAWDFLKFFK